MITLSLAGLSFLKGKNGSNILLLISGNKICKEMVTLVLEMLLLLLILILDDIQVQD